MRGRRAAAFTMIEIAIALAVIGFALVTIIGVLPMGMDVQKNNRRETIVNQDANYFLEAIRNGARGLDDLTNYVEAITISVNGAAPISYLNPASPLSGPFPNPQSLPLTNGAIIIGLLSTPKYTAAGNNYVVAYVKALSGAAVEKAPQNNQVINEAAFSYRLVVENVPYGGTGNNTYYDSSLNSQPVYQNLHNNLYDVRLLFRWPLLPGPGGQPNVGPGRQNYRLMVGGSMTNEPLNSPTWYFQPQIFTTTAP